MNSRVEILAPAGSMESMMAAVNAGADAVYMGGSRFGARAYADNPKEDRFLEAIDYAHLHGCRLYMTVNTLVKEEELSQLYDFLKPYYERGLDAVIVQDLGVWRFIREQFPDLPIHASTQMTVTGLRSAELLKELGASRVVTARELSLKEIAEIRDHVDVEIESFVHGALCYCYSGQCLLSSLIGGRSGNRGRCAQPCRLPYEVQSVDGKTIQSSKNQTFREAASADRRSGKRNTKNQNSEKKNQDDRYVLSLKDLCTLDILPDIIESGVYSLKIEGRMKSPRYTAGVVSIYRKYVDYYLQHGRDGYKVDPADRRMLLDLFDRGGFTDGYYLRHNGREMVALKEKPAFREGNQALFDRLDAEYVNKKKQEPLSGHLTVKEGEPLKLSLWCSKPEQLLNEAAEQAPYIEVNGEIAETAKNQPVGEERLLKQLNKTGNTPFYFDHLTAELEGNCFVPVQTLNELRRKALEQMEERLLSPFYRTAGKNDEIKNKETKYDETKNRLQSDEIKALADKTSGKETGFCGFHVSLEDPNLLQAALSHPDVSQISLDSCGFGAETWKAAVQACHEQKTKCSLMLPQIFRTEAKNYFQKHIELLQTAGFDEFVVKSLDEIVFLREHGLGDIPMVSDANLYVMNHLAREQMQNLGISRMTLPLELNSRELETLGCENMELYVYGYLPAMVSAQCIVRTTKGCTKQPELLIMRDRTGKDLPVKNHCRFCYNTIYNISPLSLLGQEKLIKRLAPGILRLAFTIETAQQMTEILNAFADHFLYGRDTENPCRDFTRGHFKRGVE